MNQQKAFLVEKMSTLLHKLDEESAAWLDEPENHQLWYDRGYADGIAKALQELGWAEQSKQYAIVSEKEFAQHRWMPWGKAYLHGNEKGYEETYEILAN
ncbi:MAG: hypothetical protein ACNYNY_00810 [Candidatus Oxydemutatoraceae bacterium WSBS_2016_MAG_OTU14]